MTGLWRRLARNYAQQRDEAHAKLLRVEVERDRLAQELAEVKTELKRLEDRLPSDYFLTQKGAPIFDYYKRNGQ